SIFYLGLGFCFPLRTLRLCVRFFFSSLCPLCSSLCDLCVIVPLSFFSNGPHKTNRMPSRRLARSPHPHPHRNQSRLPERINRRRLPPSRRRKLRLSQARPANGRQRTSHVATPSLSPCRHHASRDHRHRSQRKRAPPCPRNSRRHHHRLSLLHLRLFPPRQRQHDSRRIPLPSRNSQTRNPFH